MKLNDPTVVREEYATEAGLEGRRAAYRYADGPDAREIVFEAVAAARPRRVLEVGPGPGELAERLRRELGCEVVAVDLSPRMVELCRARGVDARLGDVQALPFADGEFACAVAAWVLFHAPDVDRAIAELARVLRRGGRLVAATNGSEHMRELFQLLGVERIPSPFAADSAEEQLLRHFSAVERRDASGWVTFPDRAAAQAYVGSTRTLATAGELPPLDGPLRVRRAPCVFVATR